MSASDGGLCEDCGEVFPELVYCDEYDGLYCAACHEGCPCVWEEVG